MTSIDVRRRQLTERLAELNERMQLIDEELDAHNSRDWEELATERETDEVLEGMGLSAQEEVKAIQAALERMDAGEYGYCVKCGDEISQERLDLLPYTPFCQKCAAEVARQR